MEAVDRDCDYCMSAGSVNRWGYCEVCGEELEVSSSRLVWRVDPEVALGSVLQVLEGGAGRAVAEPETTELDHANAS